jgi:hypothetical protein
MSNGEVSALQSNNPIGIHRIVGNQMQQVEGAGHGLPLLQMVMNYR